MEEETRDRSGSPHEPQPPGLLRRLLGGLRMALQRSRLPSSIGRYRVVRKIGEGGMGTVFEAEDEVLGRRVAIKRLKAVDGSARRRFWREARAVARLSHPNVCQLYEVGEDVSGPFLAMELLGGEPLSARLRRQPMTAAEVVPLGAGMLAALSAIHAAGLVHRDLKPSNVYLTPYGPRLLDFGLVRPIPADVAEMIPSKLMTPAHAISRTPLTDAEHMVGTPRYMAPEQILGETIDGRADLFATGAVLYEALAARPAFSGTYLAEVLNATLYESPPALPAPLARLDAVLQRALAKRKEDRFATAQEMAEALHAAAAAPPPAERLPAVPETGEIFVGRVAELAWLQGRLDAALAGAGGVVFVTGERGAGKSALVGEMLRQLRASQRAITLVSGRCIEHQGPGEAFQPFLDALGRFFASRARDQAVELVKTWAPTVGVLMQTALVPDPDGSLHRQTAGATRERLIRESGDFMEAATRIYPLVFLLEDLQWADAASVDMLCHLGRRAARQRILFLCTCRPSEVEATNQPLHRGMLDLRTAGQGHELALGPLGRSEIEQWLERRFPGNDFASALAPLLHARAEGLPLFVRSLFELLAGRRDIEPRAGGFQLARPPEELDLEPSKDVKDLVRAHLATLPAPERELLAAASVLGKEFSSAIARGLATGRDLELEECLQRLSRVHRVLETRGEDELPDGTLGTRYRFAHGLYQRVLYEDLVAPRRGELHRRAGELLLRHWGENAPSRAVEMAEHFERGRDVARAVRFRMLAGEHAVRRFAGAQALEHYSYAGRLLTRLPPVEARPLEVALLGRRAGAQLLLGRFDETARDYLVMLQRARDAELPAAEFEALSALCDAHFFEQRLPEMATRAGEALEAAERLGSPHQLSEAHARIAQVLVMEGRLREASTALGKVTAEARSSGSRLALQISLAWQGFVRYWQGDYAATERLAAEALVVCEERGDAFSGLAARMFLGLAHANQGRLSEAIAEFEETLALAERNSDYYWQPRLLSHLGWVHRELASVERARRFDARALSLVQGSPMPWAPEAEALINLCVDGVRAGEPDAAASLLARLEAVTRDSAWMRWMNQLRVEAAAAEHFAARGAFAESSARAAQLHRLASRLRAPGYACAAARLTAEAALHHRSAPEPAASRLARALSALRDYPAPLETWKSRRVLGLLRLRLGEAQAARDAFLAAASDIDTIAGGTNDAALRECFLASPAVREVLVHAGRA